jgi:hypothetical protein
MNEEVAEARKYATVIRVSQEFWENREDYENMALEASARRTISKHGEIVGELETSVAYESEFDRDLFPESYPEGTPPMVSVRYAAMVIRDA